MLSVHTQAVSIVLQVSLGWSHALGLDDHGIVWAWGSNRYGQCAQPLATDCTAQWLPTKQPDSSHTLSGALSTSASTELTDVVNQPTKVQAADLKKVVCISAGSEHSVAVTADGLVYAWGWGEHGQLGLGNTANAYQPQQVDVPACTQVACGSGFTIAIAAGGDD